MIPTAPVAVPPTLADYAKQYGGGIRKLLLELDKVKGIRYANSQLRAPQVRLLGAYAAEYADGNELPK